MASPGGSVHSFPKESDLQTNRECSQMGNKDPVDVLLGVTVKGDTPLSTSDPWPTYSLRERENHTLVPD